ncbi:hypothetical protein FB451DRAFT_1369828 [Mycena latifolia]|nr:hypothetical protein FB451DRAFT_1369828 [Mycena latifolia]
MSNRLGVKFAHPMSENSAEASTPLFGSELRSRVEIEWEKDSGRKWDGTKCSLISLFIYYARALESRPYEKKKRYYTELRFELNVIASCTGWADGNPFILRHAEVVAVLFVGAVRCYLGGKTGARLRAHPLYCARSVLRQSRYFFLSLTSRNAGRICGGPTLSLSVPLCFCPQRPFLRECLTSGVPKSFCVRQIMARDPHSTTVCIVISALYLILYAVSHCRPKVHQSCATGGFRPDLDLTYGSGGFGVPILFGTPYLATPLSWPLGS